MSEFNKLDKLLKKPLFHAWEARKAGVSTSLLSYYVKKGLLERIDRGVYRGKEYNLDVDFQWEDLVLAAKSIPNGVICLISALELYDLTEEIPRTHWIAVPNETKAPKRKGVKIVRMRNMKLGASKIKVGNETVPIFDRERTIVDSFRYLGMETAIKSLKMGLSKKGNEKLDLKKMQNYAKKMRVDIRPYILAVTT